jgi:hypothetical protein
MNKNLKMPALADAGLVNWYFKERAIFFLLAIYKFHNQLTCKNSNYQRCKYGCSYE